MPTMPGKLTKGWILSKIDAFTNKGLPNDTSNAEDARDKLSNFSQYKNLFDVLEALPLDLSFAEKHHLQHDWLVDKAWWPHLQPIGPILRQGLYEAARLVSEKKGYLDSYWICQAHDFEVFVTWNGRQVNLLVSTPPPPAFDSLPLPKAEKILTVKRAMALGSTLTGMKFDQATGVLTERLHIKDE